jgi:hypothetical protein
MLPTLDLSRKKRDGNGTGPGCVAHAQLLTPEAAKKTAVDFDEHAKIKCEQAHRLRRWSETLATTVMKVCTT